MRLQLSPGRFGLLVAGVVPFVLLQLALTWSVGPMARMGAHLCRLAAADLLLGADRTALATPPPKASIGPAAPGDAKWQERDAQWHSGDAPLSDDARAPSSSAVHTPDEHRSVVSSLGLAAARRAVAVRRTRPNVFVGPDSIQRAIPAPGRPTSSWTNRTPEHPAGLLIQSPGALTGVIEPGDILVEAEGKMLGSFEQLLVTVRQAYERRAKRLSGRLFRKGDMVAVTVEPGW